MNEEKIAEIAQLLLRGCSCQDCFNYNIRSKFCEIDYNGRKDVSYNVCEEWREYVNKQID